MKRETPAQAYIVDYVCDQCGAGMMQPHGTVEWMADPIQYPHKCSNCGHEQEFAVRYPYTTYRPISEAAALARKEGA